MFVRDSLNVSERVWDDTVCEEWWEPEQIYQQKKKRKKGEEEEEVEKGGGCLGDDRPHEESVCLGSGMKLKPWRKKRNERKRKNSAANSRRNFLWCQSWQMERKRNLKETLVFDVKRGERVMEWDKEQEEKQISWEMRERRKEGVWTRRGDCVNESGRSHYQC